MKLNSLTIRETMQGLRAKKFSSFELTKACLEQLKVINPQINACKTIVEEEALKQARVADEIIKSGTKLSLMGIPFTMKDAYITNRIKTTASSKVLENYIPVYSATVYRKLRDQHAILLAKDNCDAWGHGSSTENSDYGPTKNPWNLD